MSALLAPLALAAVPAEHGTYLALRTRMPSDQGIATYYQNVHRDWAWGETENEHAFAIVRDALAERPAGRVLVLGSGAGRLAYDIHARAAPALTVALDFNPLLVLLAERVTRGETVELHELPIAPLGPRVVLRRLAAEKPARAGLFHVLADAHRPPFARGVFDTVVTPWLIDILPERLDSLAARVNTLLAEGGRWINFGSLSFEASDPALRYGVEECAHVVVTAGFAAPAISQHEIPYLCSPASRHARTETLVGWAADKREPVSRAPRHEALPEWLVKGEAPVPRTDHVQLQAFATRVHAFILSLVDGRRSIKDIAEIMAEQRLMSRDEGEASVRGFFIKVYEDGRRGTGNG